MLFQTLLSASAFFLTTTSAAPSVVRRQNGPIAVTGIGGGVQPRLELRDLQQDADQWNIYLLAMARMQAMSQDNPLSWFQISGIHGRPMTAWDGVNGVSNPQGQGYCTHASNLFLTWHRPYLALYEQSVVANALDAAAEFDGEARDRYTAAAQRLRTPYWDWAKDPGSGHAIPDSMTMQTVSVTTPQGGQTIANPLYSYQFHPRPGGMGGQYDAWDRTYRWPASTSASTFDNDSQMVTAIDNGRDGWRARLYNLFANYHDYMIASNEAAGSGAGHYDSFESVHDAIHGVVGGPNGGNMNIIDVAAFDPAFWLHHTMVDRCFAIWQALNPDSYVEPQAQNHGTFWYNQGTVMDISSPLVPFFADPSGNFHTSQTIRDTTALGYTYPEVANASPDQVRQAVNQLYGGSTASTARSVVPAAAPSGLLGRSTSYGSLPSNFSSAPSLSSIAFPAREWLANIKADKYSVEGSYYIFFFVGNFTKDPSGWMNDPNLVGMHSVFSMAGGGSQKHSVLVTGVVPLTHKLQEFVASGLIPDLGEISVRRFLRSKLQWRMMKSDGCELPASAVPSLRISVVSSLIQAPKLPTEFPKWIGDFKTHTDITNGLPGGLCDNEALD
ncbi:Di-copper centre-containing protein [Trichodelitschia bisporula]|uniref:tyrosinase n=1 Tax=Trichodelitschia bisporula TaxID=703511 RepID=A0A6G1I2N2_9PEZI|nr:Di-copper centre-containing protein [Trichodelitschia bisporula]